MRYRLIAIVLLLTFLFSGCAKQKDISREDIIEAYQEAGYTVWSKVYDEPVEFGETAYIQADHPDGGYIYFIFFETAQQAKTYKQEGYHPVMMTLFLSIFSGEVYVPKWKVYGNIVIQYEEPAYYEVFEALLKNK